MTCCSANINENRKKLEAISKAEVIGWLSEESKQMESDLLEWRDLQIWKISEGRPLMVVNPDATGC